MNLLTEIKNYYGSEKNPDKTILWIALSFFIFAGVFLLLLIFNLNKHTAMMFIVSVYFIVLYFEASFVMTSLYFFQKEKDKDKRKVFKYSFLALAVIPFILTLLPVTIILAILGKLKYINLYKHYLLYITSLIIAAFLSLLLSGVLFLFLLKFNYFNSLCIFIFSVFILNFVFMKSIIWIYFKFKITKFNKRIKIDPSKQDIFNRMIEKSRHDSIHMQNEVYVLNFVYIAVGTAMIYFLHMPVVMKDIYERLNLSTIKDLKESVLFSFALYTAFDRLYDKWKKSLVDKFEKREVLIEKIEILEEKVKIIADRVEAFQEKIEDIRELQNSKLQTGNTSNQKKVKIQKKKGKSKRQKKTLKRAY